MASQKKNAPRGTTQEERMAILELIRLDTQQNRKGVIKSAGIIQKNGGETYVRNMPGTKHRPTSGVSKLGKLFRALPQML